jgi:putative spermidine/putrescine transport system permease protein/mannopine transport system permease protein
MSRRYAWLLTAPVLFLLVFFLWPLMRVVVRGFVDPSLGLTNYRQILASPVHLQVLWNTVTTAAIVTLLCLVIAYPVAFAMSRAKGARLQIMAAFVIVPLWTSVVIRSYAWMVVFQRRGVLNDALSTLGITNEPVRFLPGAFALHVGMVHIMLPFMILPLLANMRAIDGSLLRVAEVMGANPLQSFLRVFLPLSFPGISAGALLVFMMSLGFYITPALLGGPQHMMAAVLIEQQANGLLNWGLASALSTVLLAVTVVIYLAYVRIANGSLPASAALRGGERS